MLSALSSDLEQARLHYFIKLALIAEFMLVAVEFLMNAADCRSFSLQPHDRKAACCAVLRTNRQIANNAAIHRGHCAAHYLILSMAQRMPIMTKKTMPRIIIESLFSRFMCHRIHVPSPAWQTTINTGMLSPRAGGVRSSPFSVHLGAHLAGLTYLPIYC